MVKVFEYVWVNVVCVVIAITLDNNSVNHPSDFRKTIVHELKQLYGACRINAYF